METNLSPERWRRIALAAFDRFVSNKMIEKDFVVTDKGINDQDLHNLASQMKCEPEPLRIAIINSCYRIAGENKSHSIPQEEENVVIKAAAKLHLLEISVSLLNFKREFGKVAKELNCKNNGLKTSINELKAFVGPIHAEVIAEFYSSN